MLPAKLELPDGDDGPVASAQVHPAATRAGASEITGWKPKTRLNAKSPGSPFRKSLSSSALSADAKSTAAESSAAPPSSPRQRTRAAPRTPGFSGSVAGRSACTSPASSQRASSLPNLHSPSAPSPAQSSPHGQGPQGSPPPPGRAAQHGWANRSKSLASLESLLAGNRFKGSPTATEKQLHFTKGEDLSPGGAKVEGPGAPKASSPSSGHPPGETAQPPHDVGPAGDDVPQRDAAEFGMGDDELEGFFQDDLPINEYSLERKFPNGAAFSSIQRIRRTLNAYALKVSEPLWYDQFKPPTVGAVLRRLQQYKSTIEGHIDIDIQIGFRQLGARVAAMILLYKALKAWSDTKDPDCLIPTILPMGVLHKFVQASGHCFGPDLAMLRVHSEFQRALRDKTLGQAIAMFDLGRMSQCHSQLPTDRLRFASSAGVADGDGPEADGADEALGAEDSGKKKRRRTYDYTLPMVSEELWLPPTVQMAKMVANALKRRLFKVPENILEEPSEVDSLVNFLEPAIPAWENTNAPKTDDAGKEFFDIMAAVMVVVRCAWPEESRKPLAAEVRVARRLLLGTLKLTGPIGDVGKAMASGSYAGPGAVMEAARLHAAAGLEDEASNVRFDASYDMMEEKLSDAFDDIRKWVQVGAGGKAVDIEELGKALGTAKVFLGDMWCCIDRWSNAALREKQEDLEGACTNVRTLLEVGQHVMVKHIRDWAIDSFLPKAHIIAENGVVGAMSSAEAELQGEEPEAMAESTTGCDDAATIVQQPHWRRKLIGFVAVASRSSCTKLEGFWNDWLEIEELLSDMMDRMASRLGARSERKANVEALLLLLLRKHCHENAKAFERVYGYFMNWVSLAAYRPHLDKADFERLTQECRYMSALLGFCKWHYELDEMGVCVAVREEFAGDDLMAALQSGVTAFVADAGKKMLDEHAVKCIAAWAGHIMNDEFKVSPVRKEVFEQAQLHRLFPMLVLSPSSQALCEGNRLAFDGADTDAEAFAGEVYSKAYELVKYFVEYTDAKEICIPKIARVSENGEEESMASMPVKEGLLILQSTCAIRNICKVAAITHEQLLVPLSDDQPVESDDAFGYITWALKRLQVAITMLDELVGCGGAIDLELEGIRVPNPFGLLPEWQQSMAVYAGLMQKRLLTTFVELLSSVVDECKQVIPSWEAAISEERADMAMLAKMIGGKHAALVEAHNSIHSMLEQMSIAAGLLDVQPVLKDNDLSKEGVAVAMTTLGKAATASVLAAGATFYEKFRLDPQGHVKAAMFIEKNKKGSPIPNSFWQLFEEIASSSSPLAPGTAISAVGMDGSASATATGVKGERAVNGAEPQTASAVEDPASVAETAAPTTAAASATALKRRRKK